MPLERGGQVAAGVSGGQGLCPPSPTAPLSAGPSPPRNHSCHLPSPLNGLFTKYTRAFPTSVAFSALKNIPKANFFKNTFLLASERKGEICRN